MPGLIGRARQFYPHLELFSVLIGVAAGVAAVVQYLHEAQGRESARRALVLAAMDSCQSNLTYSFVQEEQPIHFAFGHIVEPEAIRSVCARVAWDFREISEAYVRKDQRDFIETALRIYHQIEWERPGQIAPMR